MHKLTDETLTRAIILSSGDSPGEYSIWCNHPTLQGTMEYKENIVLRQLSQSPERHGWMLPGHKRAGKRRAQEPTGPSEEGEQHKRARQDKPATTDKAATPRHGAYSREPSVLVIRGSSEVMDIKPEPQSTGFTCQPANPLFGGASKVPQHTTPSTRQACMPDSGMVPPVPASPSQPQQRVEKVSPQPQQPRPAVGAQRPAVLNLHRTYNIIRDHVIDQEGENGLPLMLSNDKLSKYLHSLEIAANKGYEFVFRLMREKVDVVLAKAGVTKTPTV